MSEDLSNVGQFIILITSGAIIPFLLVLYKSRCKSICFGCITRDVMDTDDENEKKEIKPKEHRLSLELKEPEPEPEPEPENNTT